MRHKAHKYGLGITREHRAAMMANMAASLIKHGRIQTTLTKAKALRPFIEKVITKAKKASVAKDKKDAIHLRRLALADVRDENAITLLFNEKVSEFKDRNGGYTRIYKLGRRDSDAAEVALIEFVKADDKGYGKKKRAKKAAKKPAAAVEAAPAAESAPAPEAAPAEAPAAEGEQKAKE